MKSTFKVERPQDISFTLTITMPLIDWEILKEQLKSGYPAWELSKKISEMVRQANKTFYQESDEVDE